MVAFYFAPSDAPSHERCNYCTFQPLQWCSSVILCTMLLEQGKRKSRHRERSGSGSNARLLKLSCHRKDYHIAKVIEYRLCFFSLPSPPHHAERLLRETLLVRCRPGGVLIGSAVSSVKLGILRSLSLCIHTHIDLRYEPSNKLSLSLARSKEEANDGEY